MIYGKIGSSEQIINNSNNPIVPDGFIEIKETRPDLNYRLNTKGKWEEFTPIPDKITRQEADIIFYEAMEVLGVPKWKRLIMYWCVRFFGKGNY